MKTIAAFAFLACLIAVEVKGQGIGSKGRCFCPDQGANRVLLKNIEMVEVIPSSRSCLKKEIIVTLKNGVKKCLNPESKFIQDLFAGLERRQQSVPHSTTVSVPPTTSRTSASTSFK